MTKVVKNQLRDVMKKAWSLFRKGILTFRQSLKEAWRVVKLVKKAVKTGMVTFWKISTGEVTTRRVAPLSGFNYEPKGSSAATETYKFVDLDKLNSRGGKVENAIISFHGFQMEETSAAILNAKDIWENIEWPFEINDASVKGNTITVTVPAEGESEYGELSISVTVTPSDDCQTIADRFLSELESAYKEAEENDHYHAERLQDERDMAYGAWCL